MSALFPLILALSAITCCTAEITAGEYAYWKEEDITAWHTYFPSRALEEERMTNVAAKNAVQNVSQGLEDSLAKIFTYQTREQEMAQMIMAGTSAQGCVQGISSVMPNALQQEISNYEDCTADALPKLQRLFNTLTKMNSTYQAAYQRALQGIESCARTYPNKDSLSRLKNCVDTWNNRYFTVANSTKYNVFSSPSMTVFINTVGVCAETAARVMVSKGWEFLTKLVHCAKLSDNVDSQTYEVQVTTGYLNYLTQNDLVAQMWDSESVNSLIVGQIGTEMMKYYDLQKRALEKYVIESRGQGHYSNQLAGYLDKYFSAVTSTSSDNPGSVECTSTAVASLNSIVYKGSLAALQCDQVIVNHTKLLIREVNEDFTKINNVLPVMGNVAILDCFSTGYIFMEKTISKCYNLRADDFINSLSEVNDYIVDKVKMLQKYEDNFFINFSPPCITSILKTAVLEAKRVLYNLERCLYMSSGTKYAVTTPPFNSSTTSPTPTTTAPTPV